MKKGIFFSSVLLVLIGLGSWQLLRLKEKELFLSELSNNMSKPQFEFSSESLSLYRYRKMKAKVRFLPEKAIYYYRLHNNVPGYEMLVPAFLPNDDCLLVSLGWKKDKSLFVVQNKFTAIEGLLVELYPPVLMSPKNDLNNNIWFRLDKKALNTYVGVSCASNLLVLYSPEDFVIGKNDFGAGLNNIPNNHFSYAFTWFALAIVWVVIYAFYIKGKK